MTIPVDLAELLEGLVQDPEFLKSAADDDEYLMRAKLVIPDCAKIIDNREKLRAMADDLHLLQDQYDDITQRISDQRQQLKELSREQSVLVTEQYYKVHPKPSA